MGQRLNIEIWHGQRCLAAAYYHWSAYTNKAAKLVEKILEAYRTNRSIPNRRYAVKLLEVTGAALTDEERAVMLEGVHKENDYKPCTGRNDGLIAVTENGINSTRMWEEFRVSIYLDQERVNFGVCNEFRWPWDWTEYAKEIKLPEYKHDMHKLPALDYDVTNIPFDKFKDFADKLCAYTDMFSPIMQQAIGVIE